MASKFDGKTGTVVFVKALCAVRDLALNYCDMSSEDSVLLDIESVTSVFNPETAVQWESVDQKLYDLLTEASEEGAHYLMLTP